MGADLDSFPLINEVRADWRSAWRRTAITRSVLCFSNGLGCWNAFYVLDGLALVTSSTGELALNSSAHTYFRT